MTYKQGKKERVIYDNSPLHTHSYAKYVINTSLIKERPTLECLR